MGDQDRTPRGRTVDGGQAMSDYVVRPWDFGTFAVYEARTKGFPAEDTWLTEVEAHRRADAYNARAVS